jgi:heterodisulfide reductase subunit C
MNEPGISDAAPPEGARKRVRIGDRGDHFLRRIEAETGANLPACYQCERCTNACPVSAYMDIQPHQVIRHIQLGWREALLASSTIWVCLSCEMCTTYCPNEVGVAETINHLRKMAAGSQASPAEPLLAEFHRTFLRELQRFGRVNEFWLMAALNGNPRVFEQKLRSGDLAREFRLGITLLRKGRLNLIPRRCTALKEIRAIYRRQFGGPP